VFTLLPLLTSDRVTPLFTAVCPRTSEPTLTPSDTFALVFDPPPELLFVSAVSHNKAFAHMARIFPGSGPARRFRVSGLRRFSLFSFPAFTRGHCRPFPGSSVFVWHNCMYRSTVSSARHGAYDRQQKHLPSTSQPSRREPFRRAREDGSIPAGMPHTIFAVEMLPSCTPVAEGTAWHRIIRNATGAPYFSLAGADSIPGRYSYCAAASLQLLEATVLGHPTL